MGAPHGHRAQAQRARRRDRHDGRRPDPRRARLGVPRRPGLSPDPLNGFEFLAEAYAATDPSYRGRVTVPVLWDKETQRIVSNNDDDIMRMFETEFDAFARATISTSIPKLTAARSTRSTTRSTKRQQRRLPGRLRDRARRVREGRARASSTSSTGSKRVATRRFLFGAVPVETDWRLFVTLIRFDAVYFGHFKCNLRRIVDYPNLWGYLRDLYQFRDVAATVNFDHIKRHYYRTHPRNQPDAHRPDRSAPRPHLTPRAGLRLRSGQAPPRASCSCP